MAREYPKQYSASQVDPNSLRHCVICHNLYIPGQGEPCAIEHIWNSGEPIEDTRGPHGLTKLVVTTLCGCALDRQKRRPAFHTTLQDDDDDEHEFPCGEHCYLAQTHTSNPSTAQKYQNGASIVPCDVLECRNDGRDHERLEAHMTAVSNLHLMHSRFPNHLHHWNGPPYTWDRLQQRPAPRH